MKEAIEQLNEKQQGIVKEIGLRKTIKLVKWCKNIYNNSCEICKKKVMNKSTDIKMEDFCEVCQDKNKFYIGKIQGLCK